MLLLHIVSMKATAVLIQEHGAIRAMLRVIEKIVEKAQRGEEINTSHLDQIVEFLEVFADKCHHGKEEVVLIPTVRRLGVEDTDYLSQTILDEHVQARNYTKGIKESLEKYKSGNRESLQELIDNALPYIKLIDSHINKENLTFFPRSDAVLSDQDQQKMFEEFEKLEIEKIGTGTHERLHKIVDELKDIYLPLPDRQ